MTLTDFEWNLVTFFIGVLSTLTYRFLKDYVPKKKKMKEINVILNWNFNDWCYIFLGGLFTVAMNPVRVVHAITFGISWEAMVSSLITNGGEKNAEKKQKR